ncbi:protein of unknown function [Magnetospirillum sp. XM-1]|nr:protein of unknown function [Magnetospirillum sp. XM-1]
MSGLECLCNKTESIQPPAGAGLSSSLIHKV